MVDGRKLKMLREAKELTTAEFGTRIGISQSMVARIETGSQQPSLALIVQIAEYFNCTVDELLKKPSTA